MAKRIRAAQTKSRLREITFELSKEGTTSHDVVKEFRRRFTDIQNQDREDLIDLGLMVLAGRVAVSRQSENVSTDLFGNEGYPDFITILASVGNRVKRLRVSRRNLTPRQYFSNDSNVSAQDKKTNSLSAEQLYRQRMIEMRDKGLLDMALPEYLELSRDGSDKSEFLRSPQNI